MISPIRAEIAHSLKSLADDKTQDIAWTPDVISLMNQPESSLFVFGDNQQLFTAPLTDFVKTHSEDKQKKMRDAYKSLMNTSGSLIKNQYPGLQGSVNSIQLVVGISDAFDSWSDKKRTGIVEPAIKTAKVLISALETLSPAIPQLQQLAPQLKTIGLFVNMGDSVYQIYTASNYEPKQL
ncbi:hypothetical protein A1359_17970 [Methylomonas lenta]|uniref:Uncharacterized protein n=2 Tax=Methylomonas lenta TaxID=980561 RepID=A0A177MYH6_9GAMM|nr:hypothetical protein A1359_17970 [Methylomonas lenta]